MTATDTKAVLRRAIADHQAGRADRAESGYREVLAADPDQPDARHLIGVLAYQRGELDQAMAEITRAIELDPNRAVFHGNLGNVYRDRGEPRRAVETFRRALRLKPDFADALSNLGNTWIDLKQTGRALSAYRQALKREPERPEARFGMANVFKHQGRAKEAADAFAKALAARPDSVRMHDNHLLALHYLPGITPTALREAHDAWYRRHGAPLTRQARTPETDPDPDRPIRLGLVSRDFGRHPVGFFLTPFVAARDRGELTLCCYADRRAEGEMTRWFRDRVDLWRTVVGMDDEALARRIREDRIDILADLSGHTAGNRLGVFARKPAPIQVAWIAYPDTTGLPAVDYIVCDRQVLPEGDEPWYVERPLRLPDGYLCYGPPATAPPVSPPPAVRRGFVTFGCFNNTAKVSREVVECWAAILRAVPGSRLALRSIPLDDRYIRRLYRRLFADNGVTPDRVDMDGTVSHYDYLAGYGGIDIALDPFPFPGGLTTCEALYMGVPVVSLAGETFVSRQGRSILSAAGLGDWVAATESDYQHLAISRANRIDDLARLRAGLRDQILASPLCDGPRYARAVTTAFRRIWREHCETMAAPSRLRLGGGLEIPDGEGPEPEGDGPIRWMPDGDAPAILDLSGVRSDSVAEIRSVLCLARLLPGDHDRALAESIRVLAPGGRAVFFVPDLAAIAAHLRGDGPVRPLFRDGDGSVTPMDLLFGRSPSHPPIRTGMTGDRIVQILRKAGLERVRGGRIRSRYLLWAVGHKPQQRG